MSQLKATSHLELDLKCYQQRKPDDPGFSLAFFLILKPFDLDRFRHAYHTLIQRHEALRTRFVQTHEGFMVEFPLLLAENFEVPIIDLSNETVPDFDQSYEEWKERYIDPLNDPMIRTAVFKVSDEEYRAAIFVEHIIADQRSLGLLREELLHVYEKGDHLRETGAQLSDYISWKNNLLDQQNQQIFWSEMIANSSWEVKTPELNATYIHDFTQPEFDAGEWIAFKLSGEEYANVLLKSQEAGISTFGYMLGTLVMSSVQYFQQSKLTTAVIYGESGASQFAQTIANCVEALFLTHENDPKQPSAEVLFDVYMNFLGAISKRFPWTKLPESVLFNRSFFMFNYLNANLVRNYPELEEDFTYKPGVCQKRLMSYLEVFDTNETIFIRCNYSLAFWNRNYVMGFFTHFRNMIRTV